MTTSARDRDTDPAAGRRVAVRVDLSARAARAVSGQAGLRQNIHGWWQDGERLDVRAPHVHPDLGSTDRRCARGASDAVAVLARFSDRRLRGATTPTDDLLAELVFGLLEQLRAEAVALDRLGDAQPGLARNLRHRFDAWTQEALGAAVLEDEQSLVVLTLAQVAHVRLTGGALADDLSDLLEATRIQLAAHLGAPLRQLRRHRDDQAAFAVPARHIARTVSALFAQERAARAGSAPSRSRSVSRTALALLAGFTTDHPDDAPPALQLARHDHAEAQGYRVFTTAHDRCDPAHRLVPRPERAALHDALVELAREAGPAVGSLAAQMLRLLTAPTPSGFESDLEEGLLDPRKLPQVVATPGRTAAFRLPGTGRARRTAVTVLLDCSGSMKGHRARLAPLLLGWARAADRAGIPGEVLGHTTRSWNGGAAKRDWRRAARPAVPGRLADLQLIRFTGNRRPGPQDLAPLLRPFLYRESITGEAVEWSVGRLRELDADRRVLVLITDGAPGDAATARVNGPGYLDDHLDRVLSAVRARGEVEVVGAGIGTDIGALCDRHVVLDLDESLDHVARDLLRVVAHR